ncbi:hypothetical protein ERJ75_000954200 [Trypanosoma vivax]|nr:hypothetical protein ERJ75_000953900 [Trypanosoma vivax]KAH8611317.1 hypothetical protein ERJ75_000954100 [Trypanosoma vivax]KAH8611386.1 hypothetical protein ERJ75_000954200 [Trypanosoma vivax]
MVRDTEAMLITPLFEITSLVWPMSLVMGSQLGQRRFNVFRTPPLYSNGSERMFGCTHNYASTHSRWCDMRDFTDEPVSEIEVVDQLVLRYQLNPNSPPDLPPPPGFKRDIFRNQRPYLRPVCLEPLVLPCGSADGGVHDACGINLCTRATGLFTDFPQPGREGIAVIYSTVPSMRAELFRLFAGGKSGLPVFVDDVFISWDAAGLLSLNELSGVCAMNDGPDCYELADALGSK